MYIDKDVLAYPCSICNLNMGPTYCHEIKKLKDMSIAYIVDLNAHVTVKMYFSISRIVRDIWNVKNLGWIWIKMKCKEKILI